MSRGCRGEGVVERGVREQSWVVADDVVQTVGQMLAALLVHDQEEARLTQEDVVERPPPHVPPQLPVLPRQLGQEGVQPLQLRAQSVQPVYRTGLDLGARRCGGVEVE